MDSEDTLAYGQYFFELIQVSLGKRICLSHTPSADEWGELYKMAKKQSLVGVCFAGVQELGFASYDNDDDRSATKETLGSSKKDNSINPQPQTFQRSCTLRGWGWRPRFSSVTRLLIGSVSTWNDYYKPGRYVVTIHIFEYEDGSYEYVFRPIPVQ